MGDKTSIEWTDATWNPIRGCSIVSKGCQNCYAMKVASRFSGPRQPYEGLAQGGKWTGVVREVPEKLGEPLRWTRPRRIFVNSMSDLFHEALPDAAIDRIFGVMMMAQRHVFQVLTKRPQRMLEYLTEEAVLHRIWCEAVRLGWPESEPAPAGWPLPNVWVGVTAEDQHAAEDRIPLLLRCPARVRWVSYEPAVGPVDLEQWLTIDCERCDGNGVGGRGEHCPVGFCPHDHDDLGEPRRLDWVVAGGESGPGARPAHPQWFRTLRDQCKSAGVPFLFKQWGSWVSTAGMYNTTRDMLVDRRDGSRRPIVGGWGLWEYSKNFEPMGCCKSKEAAGRMLDGRTHDEYPGG